MKHFGLDIAVGGAILNDVADETLVKDAQLTSVGSARLVIEPNAGC